MRSLVYLSLGSNVGDRQRHLREALSRLDSQGRILSLSSFYETEPVEFADQAWFLNCAAALETAQRPQELLANILGIEQDMGRRRTWEKGPRTIDIDILMLGDTVINTPDLTIPHPSMHERRFVLEPLAEIAPQALHPVSKKTVRQLLDELPAGQEVRKMENQS
jgi:2-amino-4-hydroxy-6-hydroxymethyldihydropteridine diphosphokinase